MKDKTTIITRIRNRNSILSDTLHNWLQFNIPIIIVDYRDDGCELAWDVVKSYKDNVTVIETKYEYNFNPAHAWNLGISQCQTEYVLLLDIDDILTHDFFDKNAPIDGCFISGWGKHSLFGVCYIKKAYFDKSGGFNENMLYMGNADQDLYKRLEALGYRQMLVLSSTAHHKDHPRNLTIINSFQDASTIVPEEHAWHHLRNKMNELNGSIMDLVPWSIKSKRCKWTLTEIEQNRLQAIRVPHAYVAPPPTKSNK